MLRNRSQGFVIKYVKSCSAADTQILNVIELVEFCDSFGNVPQIPPGRRWHVTSSVTSVEFSVAFEYSVDRSPGRQRRAAHLEHITSNGIGSMFSERTVFFEFFSEFQNALFDAFRGSILRRRRFVGPVGPIDAIQTFAFCSFDPSLDGCFAHTKLCRHGSHRFAAANGRHHVTSLPRREPLVFVSSCLSSSKRTFQINTIITYCPTSR